MKTIIALILTSTSLLAAGGTTPLDYAANAVAKAANVGSVNLAKAPEKKVMGLVTAGKRYATFEVVTHPSCLPILTVEFREPTMFLNKRNRVDTNDVLEARLIVQMTEGRGSPGTNITILFQPLNGKHTRATAPLANYKALVDSNMIAVSSWLKAWK